jgi:hypothetical protein
MDEIWKAKVDGENKKCNEARVRLEEHEKAQQKEIDNHETLISDLFDYKNDIYRKITENKANAVTKSDFDEVAESVTQLKTEKKFMPWLFVGISIILSIASVVYVITQLAGG